LEEKDVQRPALSEITINNTAGEQRPLSVGDETTSKEKGEFG